MSKPISGLLRAQSPRDAAVLALGELRAQPARSALAMLGIVVGIVTVVLVASTLVGLRNSVAELFRELGTDNVFAYHRGGDPYSAPTEADVDNPQLTLVEAEALARLSPAVREVALELIVPVATESRVLTARAGGNEADNVLVEGVSANFHDVAGAEFQRGRPLTDSEARVRAQVAVLGASVARALFGGSTSVGQSFLLGGDRYYVVGELAPRRGAFFGENRNDNVIAIPYTTARVKFPDARNLVLYLRAETGRREQAREDARVILRTVRRVPAGRDDNFNLSSADQIIAQFDRLGAQIFLATVALAAMSLVIGGIGIANVMIISVTERTREIGVRLAVGARRADVRRQFLLEAAMLSGAGGVIGVVAAAALGAAAALALPNFPAAPPVWSVTAGLLTSVIVGVAAGYLPARRASSLDPVEALRYE